MLLQEEFQDNPWKMLVACILLNQTNRVQVKQVIYDLFDAYPTPEALARANPSEVREIIRSLGLQNNRSRTLIWFSEDWADPDILTVDDCYGCGKYATDSYRIFIEGNLNADPDDKELRKYLASIKTNN